MVVRHIFPAKDTGDEHNYRLELLTLLLEKSSAKYGPYFLQDLKINVMTQARAFRQLQAGDLDVVGSMTDTDREDAAIPVRYCIYRGLLGIRVGMGVEAVVRRLDAVTTRAELDAVTFGQVFDWPDYAIQKAAGLQVDRLQDFEIGIYKLKKGGMQLFPLGVVEVAPIARSYGLSTIAAWALAYPTAFYFFVSRRQPLLAERLAFGVEQVIRDLSFERLFARRIEPLIAQTRLEKRQLFKLANPLLPAQTPVERKELWHPVAAKLNA